MLAGVEHQAQDKAGGKTAYGGGYLENIRQLLQKDDNAADARKREERTKQAETLGHIKAAMEARGQVDASLDGENKKGEGLERGLRFGASEDEDEVLLRFFRLGSSADGACANALAAPASPALGEVRCLKNACSARGVRPVSVAGPVTGHAISMCVQRSIMYCQLSIDSDHPCHLMPNKIRRSLTSLSFLRHPWQVPRDPRLGSGAALPASASARACSSQRQVVVRVAGGPVLCVSAESETCWCDAVRRALANRMPEALLQRVRVTDGARPGCVHGSEALCASFRLPAGMKRADRWQQDDDGLREDSARGRGWLGATLEQGLERLRDEATQVISDMDHAIDQLGEIHAAEVAVGINGTGGETAYGGGYLENIRQLLQKDDNAADARKREERTKQAETLGHIKAAMEARGQVDASLDGENKKGEGLERGLRFGASEDEDEVLLRFFREVDVDGTGTVTLEELLACPLLQKRENAEMAKVLRRALVCDLPALEEALGSLEDADLVLWAGCPGAAAGARVAAVKAIFEAVGPSRQAPQSAGEAETRMATREDLLRFVKAAKEDPAKSMPPKLSDALEKLAESLPFDDGLDFLTLKNAARKVPRVAAQRMAWVKTMGLDAALARHLPCGTMDDG